MADRTSRSPQPNHQALLHSAWFWALLTLVLGAALVIASGALAGDASPDYQSFYEPAARAILAGDAYRVDGAPAVRYPPGFPVLLALEFGLAEAVGVSERTVVLLVQVLCWALSVFLVVRLAGSFGAGRLAGLAVVTWFPTWLLLRMPGSEVPFLLMFWVTISIVWKGTQKGRTTKRAFALALLAGAAGGLAALVRPIAFLWCLPLAIVVWRWPLPRLRLRAGAVALLVAGTLLAIAPWQFWMAKEADVHGPLSSGGRLSVLDGLTIGVKPWLTGDEMPIPSDVRALMQRVDDARGEFSGTGDVVRFMLAEAARHPLPVVKITLLKAARSWFAVDSQRREPLLLLYQLPYVVIFGIALALGLRSENRRIRDLAVLASGSTLYFWIMTTGVLSILRYMVPPIGLLLLLSAVVWNDRLERRHEGAAGL